jgi:hypothetical protein
MNCPLCEELKVLSVEDLNVKYLQAVEVLKASTHTTDLLMENVNLIKLIENEFSFRGVDFSSLKSSLNREGPET